MQNGAAAQVTIATQQKSTFSIVTPADAPQSVQSAAQELQKSIELATGARLPLINDTETASGPIISLGETRQASASGISSKAMAEESYRILTRDGNLYILGNDTPDGQRTRDNGTSNGTANGIYTFLEKYLDVRWLMPGDVGRDVPEKSTFTLPALDLIQTPQFKMRRMRYLQDYTNRQQYNTITDWMARQRLFASVDLRFAHNWWHTVNKAAGLGVHDRMNTPAIQKFYEEHPEWVAMDKDGKRPYPSHTGFKFETTNQDLVKWFAEQSIKIMKESGQEHPTWSLSPSDGNYWSESPESKALYDANPDTSFDPEITDNSPSMSSLVMKWYHDIAEIVAKEYPQGRLTGYIYASFVYPPQKVSAKLPENFIAQIAPGRTASYMLYRDDVQNSYKTVMDDWAKIITGDWYYYGLPIDLIDNGKLTMGRREDGFHGSVGNILATSPDILNTVFHQLAASHINGTTIYGLPSWSSAALSNYLLAKMQWDPTQDANELQREWLERAYGTQAGAIMEKFYIRLADEFRRYYRENPKAGYRMDPEIFKSIYSKVYPDLEKYFLQAKAQPMTGIQKQRFQLLEDNMVVLQWRLRNAQYLPAANESPLQRTDGQVNAIIAQDNPSFPLFPGVTSSLTYNQRKNTPLPWEVLLATNDQHPEKSALPDWKDNQLLLVAAQDGDVRIRTKMAKHGAYFAGYEITNSRGEIVKQGIFNVEDPITFSAKSGEAYLLTFPVRKPTSFELEVENAALASGNLQQKTLLLSGTKAPVHIFYVPGKEPIGVTQRGESVSIKMPYSGYQAEHYARGRFKEVRSVDALDTDWKFQPDPQNDGQKRGVLKADFDDSSWSNISPLNWWQKQDPKFSDYHGAAWYRVKFDAPQLEKNEHARLYFGAVDGNANVYLNGRKVYEHRLGANYEGWDKAFAFYVHPYLKEGENILIVKVTSKNDTTASGIHKGVAFIMGKSK